MMQRILCEEAQAENVLIGKLDNKGCFYDASRKKFVISTEDVKGRFVA